MERMLAMRTLLFLALGDITLDKPLSRGLKFALDL
jgi:hypothetical protein